MAIDANQLSQLSAQTKREFINFWMGTSGPLFENFRDWKRNTGNWNMSLGVAWDGFGSYYKDEQEYLDQYIMEHYTPDFIEYLVWKFLRQNYHCSSNGQNSSLLGFGPFDDKHWVQDRLKDVYGLSSRQIKHYLLEKLQMFYDAKLYSDTYSIYALSH